MKSIAKVEKNFTLFRFGQHSIRVVMQNDDPWFVAEDVCCALDLSNPSMSLKSLDDDERSKFSLGRQGEANIVSESGMYTLVLRCRDAVNKGSVPHQFRKWVTSEVLPAIRKTGSYVKEAPKRAIRRREDLSFTKRDANGCLINWNVPTRQDCWHENVRIGQEFFNEIIELSHNNPQEAYEALTYSVEAMTRFKNKGHEVGFIEHLARWAMAGLLGGVKPEGLKIKLADISKEPVEGIQHYFGRIH